MGDTVIAEGAVIERCIIDKQAYIGAGSRLSFGDDTPNMLDPRRVNTGITLVGKNARVPAKSRSAAMSSSPRKCRNMSSQASSLRAGRRLIPVRHHGPDEVTSTEQSVSD
jgi:NDP-sugar pyrophosphorylase family protein